MMVVDGLTPVQITSVATINTPLREPSLSDAPRYPIFSTASWQSVFRALTTPFQSASEAQSSLIYPLDLRKRGSLKKGLRQLKDRSQTLRGPVTQELTRA